MRTEVTPAILNEFVRALTEHNMTYLVIGGFGLDGRRRQQTRPHQDLDILCLKKDEKRILLLVEQLRYSCRRYHDLCKLKREDGAKIDLALVTIDGKDAVIYGRIAITRFSKDLLDQGQPGMIPGSNYTIAPDAPLKVWGKNSQNQQDRTYAQTISVLLQTEKRIQRTLRNH